MSEHVDVLIVGAGLSGIGAAVRLREGDPDVSLALLEGRERLGGTWDLFRYPGIRSDSDMYTLSYPFRPWENPKSIADGSTILGYLQDTARGYGVDRLIRYRHRARAASWSSERQEWSVEVDTPDGMRTIGARFLYLATGYYNYEHGHVVDFPGQGDFAGRIIHPQHWPADADLTDRRIVIIGSGATAVTLVPALVEAGAGHVTMLQRSPSYLVNLPEQDSIALALRRVLPALAAHRVTRAKNIAMNLVSYQALRRFPVAGRRLLTRLAREQLPEGYDMAQFTPAYDPWDERLCVVPDGDLFEAVSSGSAEVVTGHIATFTHDGIRLTDGRELAADVIVTATGLDLLMAGGIALDVDGTATPPSQEYVYRGCMLSDVPNLAWSVGYTNSSWTLRADLVARYVTRLLRHLRTNGFTSATPRYDGPRGGGRPLIDLTAGYVQRATDLMPRQGDTAAWQLKQNYVLDSLAMSRPVDDGHLEFTRAVVGAEHGT